MKCLYEVLKASCDADAAQLKRSYRKLALELHPDKNPGDSSAYERFQELQRAWEVLSDPQERAWYDSNRSSILQSGAQATRTHEGIHTPSPHENLHIQRYMSPGFTPAFDDTETGFLQVYNALFARIHDQEHAAVKMQASNKRTNSSANVGSKDHASESLKKVPPPFGASDADATTIRAFYAHWSCFQTIKDFSWLDPYDPQSGSGRSMRRLLEAENAKTRKAGKVAFVREVRELVEWVRAHDRRLQQLSEQEEAKRRERDAMQEAKVAASQAERQRAAAAYEDAEWIKASEQQQLEELDKMQQGVNGAEANHVHECVVCDKVYRTARALQRHKGGANHQRQLQLLRLQLQAEDALCLGDT